MQTGGPNLRRIHMENVLAVALFDLALLVPPLAVVIGIVLLALPSRSKEAVRPTVTAHAA